MESKSQTTEALHKIYNTSSIIFKLTHYLPDVKVVRNGN